MASEKQVLAERSSSIFAWAVMLWLITILGIIGRVWIAVSETDPETLKLAWVAVFFIVVCFPFAVYYTVLIIKLPPVLAEFSDGKIYFYPKKGVEIAVNPEEIGYISQKNSSGRGITYSFGRLTIELNSQTIELTHVREIDWARREIEELKAQAWQKAGRQKEIEQV